MKVIYRADDGTEFYSEDECERYEEKQRIGEMKLASRFWDHKGRPMEIDDLAKTVERAYYVEYATKEEAVFIDEYAYERVGCCIFDDIGDAKAGRYYYDSEYDTWRNIEVLYEPYRKMLAIFEGE